jgi:hypothetical protein
MVLTQRLPGYRCLILSLWRASFGLETNDFAHFDYGLRLPETMRRLKRFHTLPMTP